MRWQEVVREAVPDEPVSAVKPLTPAASRKRAKRKDAIHRQIQTAQSVQARRLNDLRSELGET
jgi:hypothetical protein